MTKAKKQTKPVSTQTNLINYLTLLGNLISKLNNGTITEQEELQLNKFYEWFQNDEVAKQQFNNMADSLKNTDVID